MNNKGLKFLKASLSSLLVRGLLIAGATQGIPQMEAAQQWITVSADKSRFELKETRKPFRVWGVNYDHDELDQRLLENYWHEEWATVEEDFREIQQLGANVVRIHLQFGAFMDSASEPNQTNLRQLKRLLHLAESTGLYLDITGLGCYHKQDVPEWYDSLTEKQRWQAQAQFWSAVAKTCSNSPAVFCYDLMNEPILPGRKKETEWLAGAFAGNHFVQRISLDLAGRTREEVAATWVETLVTAIRNHDQHHLITVGVIPWAMTWPNAKPLFYSPTVARHLDFVAVHFYPEKGKSEKALQALRVYDIGKPLVVEEFFPLKCGADELEAFIHNARNISEGWISFYWGKTAAQYRNDPSGGIAAGIKAEWLDRFKDLSRQMR